MNLNLAQSKQLIREQMRQVRQAISRSQSQAAGESLCQHLTGLEQYATASKIACFLSFDGEISTQPILERILADKTLCYLPKLKPFKPNRLWFMPYQADSIMCNNRYEIPEVDLPVNLAERISHLDILLMPLVAFDESGNRLGMGGGFYDASLAHLDTYDKRPLCLGLAFEAQKVEQVPSESWDYQIDGVITENRVYWF